MLSLLLSQNCALSHNSSVGVVAWPTSTLACSNVSGLHSNCWVDQLQTFFNLILNLNSCFFFFENKITHKKNDSVRINVLNKDVCYFVLKVNSEFKVYINKQTKILNLFFLSKVDFLLWYLLIKKSSKQS